MLIPDLLHYLADDPPTSGISSTVVGQLIASLGLVLAATVPVLVARNSRRRNTHPLNSDADDEEGEDSPERDRIRALERFLWLRHFDPNRINDGGESDDYVRY